MKHSWWRVQHWLHSLDLWPFWYLPILLRSIDFWPLIKVHRLNRHRLNRQVQMLQCETVSNILRILSSECIGRVSVKCRVVTQEVIAKILSESKAANFWAARTDSRATTTYRCTIQKSSIISFLCFPTCLSSIVLSCLQVDFAEPPQE